MVNVIGIDFDGNLPTAVQIREKVEEVSGLKIEMSLVAPTAGTFGNGEFRFPCVFRILEKQVTLDLSVTRWSYLDWAVIKALVDLGGKWAGKPLPVPDYVSKPWAQRKWWQFLPR